MLDQELNVNAVETTLGDGAPNGNLRDDAGWWAENAVETTLGDGGSGLAVLNGEVDVDAGGPITDAAGDSGTAVRGGAGWAMEEVTGGEETPEVPRQVMTDFDPGSFFDDGGIFIDDHGNGGGEVGHRPSGQYTPDSGTNEDAVAEEKGYRDKDPAGDGISHFLTARVDPRNPAPEFADSGEFASRETGRYSPDTGDDDVADPGSFFDASGPLRLDSTEDQDTDEVSGPGDGNDVVIIFNGENAASGDAGGANTGPDVTGTIVSGGSTHIPRPVLTNPDNWNEGNNLDRAGNDFVGDDESGERADGVSGEVTDGDEFGPGDGNDVVLIFNGEDVALDNVDHADLVINGSSVGADPLTGFITDPLTGTSPSESATPGSGSAINAETEEDVEDVGQEVALTGGLDTPMGDDLAGLG